MIGAIKHKISNIFHQEIRYHGLFWLLLWLAMVVFDDRMHGIGFAMGIQSINILFIAVIVYFNLLYLFPNYLNQKNFLIYTLLLLVSALIITPIKTIVLYFFSFNFPDIQSSVLQHQQLIFLSSFLFAGASSIFKIVVDWFQQKQDKIELQTQTMQSELNFLKSQINPHFLFNTLNNLYALTLKKSDQAPEIVLKLSEMMRYMLYECNEPKVLLSKEVHYMKNYLELEKIRQGPKAEIHLEINGEAYDKKIAPLMFIPFLENSFKHGLNSSISEGYVEAVLNIKEDSIHFHIENSKAQSMPRQMHKRSGGIGLVNVKRRLNILYPEKYDLTLSDNPNAYHVDLKIELD